VEEDDTEATLAARILVEEHRLYPAAVRLFAEGRLTIHGRRVIVGQPR
jgi:phosphoribosylglycinamide formyltransferase 1